MANDRYILSNDYYVEIQKRGPEKVAVLFTPTELEVIRGPGSLTAPISTLIEQVIKEYNPDGRLDDPARWTNVPTVIREELAPKDIIQRIRGGVYDLETGESISAAEVTLGKQKEKTDNDGVFRFRVTLKEGETPPSSLSVTKSGYSPATDIPTLRLDGSLKSSLNLIGMDSLKKSLEKEEAEVKVLEEETINKVKRFDVKSIEARVIDTVNQEVNNLLERAIPAALNALVAFGITKVQQTASKTCPPLPQISGAINQKNKLTRQLNNSFKTISSVASAGNILSNLLTVAKLIFKLLKANPTPTAVGTPPGPAGGLLPPPLTKTMGQVTSFDEKREKINKLIERLDNISKALVPAVIPMTDTLGKLTGLLSTVDNMCGDCLVEARQKVVDEINKQQGLTTTTEINDLAQEQGISFQEAKNILDRERLNQEQNGFNAQGQNGFNTQGGNLSVTDVDFTQIDENRLKDILGIDRNEDVQVGDLLAGNYLQVGLDRELTALTEQAAKDGEPSVTEYNGFILSVETESEEAAQGKSIKRRFAVGKNKDGVVLVQGEKSYSSNDQILIDELIFTIEQQDLKAN